MLTLLDTPRLARELGVGSSTLEKWRLKGSGPRFIRLGGKVAYDAKDVEAWLEAQKAESTSTPQAA
jgi:predicted DNA-binding transcriptional regulator AlpA